ncbi:MAG: Chaperone SurA [Phycisphaerae bacterium]|nr:Chaperone SurA [Phycisphaerae bacterium]
MKYQAGLLYGFMGVLIGLLGGCGKDPPPHAVARAKKEQAIQKHRAEESRITTAPANTTDILEINNEIITLDDLLNEVAPILIRAAKDRAYAQYAALVDQTLQNLLRKKVQDSLLFQAAVKQVDEALSKRIEEVIDQELRERINKDFGGRQTRLEEYLAQQQRSLNDERNEIRRQIVIYRYLNDYVAKQVADPTRQELWDFYQQNLEEYTSEERRQLLLIDIPKENDPLAAHQNIEAALTELQAGTAFEEVARKYSRGLKAEQGGDWGLIREPLQGRYAPPSQRLFQMAAGQLSEIIETDEAYFLVKVGTIEAAQQRNFTEVQPELVRRYRDYQFEIYRVRRVQELLSQAIIHPDEAEFLAAAIAAAQSKYDYYRRK